MEFAQRNKKSLVFWVSSRSMAIVKYWFREFKLVERRFLMSNAQVPKKLYIANIAKTCSASFRDYFTPETKV